LSTEERKEDITQVSEVIDEGMQSVSHTPNNKLLRDIVETVLIALVLIFAVNIISARIRVESISMEPTLNRGDFILVEKISYWLDDPKRGDIVVFQFPADRNQMYIKRVIGLPGDQIFISNGRISINSEVIDEPYVKALPAYSGNWNVPDNSIFVLGDNRNRSNDSHIWGMVPYDNILGKALLTYWPFSRMSLMDGILQR
jgi:signal peptidase I